MAVTAWHPGRLAIVRLDASVSTRPRSDASRIARRSPNPAIAHASSGDAESPGDWSAA
jgi:hypothetical protein